MRGPNMDNIVKVIKKKIETAMQTTGVAQDSSAPLLEEEERIPSLITWSTREEYCTQVGEEQRDCEDGSLTTMITTLFLYSVGCLMMRLRV